MAVSQSIPSASVNGRKPSSVCPTTGSPAMLLPPPTTGSSLTLFTVMDIVTGAEYPPLPSETWNENTSRPTKSCGGW